MMLEVARYEHNERCTVGRMSIDGEYECFTLEDVVREVTGQPVAAWKIPGETAIPAGVYPVVLTWWPKFKRFTPSVINVPGFSGIRIHSGNRDTDTEGCVLVGQTHPDHQDFIGSSRLALEGLMRKIEPFLGFVPKAFDADGFVIEYEKLDTPAGDLQLRIG